MAFECWNQLLDHHKDVNPQPGDTRHQYGYLNAQSCTENPRHSFWLLPYHVHDGDEECKSNRVRGLGRSVLQSSAVAQDRKYARWMVYSCMPSWRFDIIMA